MIQRRTRDYEVSLWSLQDSFIAILKQYGLEYKGQIQEPQLTDKDDGTQSFTFTIPMYIIKNGQRIENPGWYSIKDGALLVNMRKIKVIFNKDAKKLEDRKIYEFLITNVTERHQNDQLYCDVECEGLAFHELGKIGYKISLSADDFYNDDYDWSHNGVWYDGYGKPRTQEPLATLQYWNDKVFAYTNNWTYEIQMNWDSYSLQYIEEEGNLQDYATENDTYIQSKKREPNKVYEEDFVDSWKNDEKTGKLVPMHVTEAREKARVSLNIEESNIYNITQTLAETFGVFCKYVYEHDINCHIIGRKVVYYNNFFNEGLGTLDITYPYQTSSVQRNIDSSDLVTKLFVKSVENTASAAGLTSIIDVGANKSQEDYILNFDYLHKIGGITDEQYASVDDYILQMHNINTAIEPLSARIISLQGQVTKLEAQKTTLTNAVAKDTEELEASTALLDALTDKTGILSVNERHPQSAVLLKDTSKTNNSYYIKLTQQGIYSETINVYKYYNYTTAALTQPITTGKIEFDESGNVIKITNLFINDTDPKTVYITYDYRPALYYERLTNMWTARLGQDQASLKKVTDELDEINYILQGKLPDYQDGTIAQWCLKYMNLERDIIVGKEKDINLIGQYRAILTKKQNIINTFNASMGLALREGYWQPEDYSDYGDKYNDSFWIGLNSLNTIEGTTGNSYFEWDSELFPEEQNLYYEYGIDQKKIPYPCIDLSKRPDIVKMILASPDMPISFVFKPQTADDENPLPRHKPTLKAQSNTTIFVPNLYHYYQDSIPEEQGIIRVGQYWINSNEIPQYDIIEPVVSSYLPALKMYFSNGFKWGYTDFSWYAAIRQNQQHMPKAAEHTIGPITQLRKNAGTPEYITKNEYKNIYFLNCTQEDTRPYLYLKQYPTPLYNTLYSYRVAAFNSNMGYQETDPLIYLRTLTKSSISLPTEQTSIKFKQQQQDSTSKFTIRYVVTNQAHQEDLAANRYIWNIVNASSKQLIGTVSYWQPTEENQSLQQVFDNQLASWKDHIHISVSGNQHELILDNNGLFFKSLSTKELQIFLEVKNLWACVDQNQTSVIPEDKDKYQLIITDGTPIIDSFEGNAAITLNDTENQFVFTVFGSATTAEVLETLEVEWKLKIDSDSNVIELQQGQTILDDNNNLLLTVDINPTIEGITYSNQLKLIINDDKTEELSLWLNLHDVRIGCYVSNEKTTQSTIKFRQTLPLSTTRPIIIEENQWYSFVPLQPIGPEDHQAYIEQQYEVKSQYATTFNWYIMPSQLEQDNDPLLFTVNDRNLSVESESNAYTYTFGGVPFSRYRIDIIKDEDNNITGSKLIIRIPVISYQTADQITDNGTRFICQCTNASGVKEYVPTQE